MKERFHEKGQHLISRRARKLLGKAFKVGFDPLEVKGVLSLALDDTKSKGKEGITRGDLKSFESKVRAQTIFHRWDEENTILGKNK